MDLFLSFFRSVSIFLIVILKSLHCASASCMLVILGVDTLVFRDGFLVH